MWVAADAHYIYQGKRNLSPGNVSESNEGTKSCCKVERVMNVTADGRLLSGMDDAILQRIRVTTPILMMYNDSIVKESSDGKKSRSSSSSNSFSDDSTASSSSSSTCSNNKTSICSLA
uniref:Uncharacterized protein n=1 Tax=Lygus hesperus TaxID=30085 RepID=A0A0A9VVB0_LYGHE